MTKEIETNPGRSSDPRASIVVVNGCPRSGTSFVDTFLSKRLNAALMFESHFLPSFARQKFLWGDLGNAKKRRRLVDAIYEFIAIRLAQSGLLNDDGRLYSLLATESSKDKIVDVSSSYSETLSQLYERYGQYHGASVALEKTAYYRPIDWDLIADSLPNARFIHVVRDGRDVALSWMQTWFGPRNILLAARLWADHVDKGLSFERSHPDKVHRVKYEELIAQPENVLQSIADFLGLPVSASDLEQSSLGAVALIGGHSHMVNLGKSTDSENFQKWRARMSSTDLSDFEAVAARQLQALGYNLASEPPARLTASSRARLFVAQCLDFARIVQVKRSLSRFLPFFLFVAQKLNISITSLLVRRGSNAQARK